MLGLFRLFGKMSKYLPKNDSETITQKKCGQHLQSCLGHIWHCLTSWHHKAASNEPQVDQIPSTSGRLSTCYKLRRARLMTFMQHLVCRKQLCVLCLIQMCLLCGKTCCYFLFFLWCVVVCVNQESGPFPPLVVECEWTHLGSLCQEVLKQYWFYHVNMHQNLKGKNSSSLSQWREKLGQF